MADWKTFSSDGVEIAFIDEGAGDPVMLMSGERVMSEER